MPSPNFLLIFSFWSSRFMFGAIFVFLVWSRSNDVKHRLRHYHKSERQYELPYNLAIKFVRRTRITRNLFVGFVRPSRCPVDPHDHFWRNNIVCLCETPPEAQKTSRTTMWRVNCKKQPFYLVRACCDDAGPHITTLDIVEKHGSFNPHLRLGLCQTPDWTPSCLLWAIISLSLQFVPWGPALEA